MITIGLFLLGLCLGSFINALVWRLHENKDWVKERSVCPKCNHVLSALDLVPLVSWLFLRGKCRYCKQPISWQYPIVELITAGLFVLSYIYWPHGFEAMGITLFVFWTIFLVGLVALAIYDLRWMLLPDKIVYPLLCLALVQGVLLILAWGYSGWDIAISLLIGGGLFYAIFQVSKGRWIGGGDVKLGALIGLILASPSLSLLMIFSASALGSIVSVPMILTGKAKRDTRLPFGPFLIAACIIVYLFGGYLIDWYKELIIY
jgi:leader peptidase (prepilin peptidase)/N-methyltransferase